VRKASSNLKAIVHADGRVRARHVKALFFGALGSLSILRYCLKKRPSGPCPTEYVPLRSRRKSVIRTKSVFLDSCMRNQLPKKSFQYYRRLVLREPMFWMLAIIGGLSGYCQYHHTF
jgi:hypothetical protein